MVQCFSCIHFKLRLHDATGCPTGWKSVYTVQPVGTIGWKYVYTTQPVGQQVVSTDMNKLHLQIMNRFQWGRGHIKKGMLIYLR